MHGPKREGIGRMIKHDDVLANIRYDCVKQTGPLDLLGPGLRFGQVQGVALSPQRNAVTRLKMPPQEPRDKEQIGRIGERGLFLISDRTLSWEWQSLPRRDPKPACERLGPIRSNNTRAKRWPEAKK
jgi:hypothetical protein